MKKILVIVLAFAMVMSLAAAAFAAPAADDGKVLTVKFITGEITKATSITAPYGEEGEAAVALADKAVMDKETAYASLSEDLVKVLKGFFAENADSIAEGVINLGDDVIDGSITLAVDAGGYDKVMFTAPGNVDNLAFVIVIGDSAEDDDVAKGNDTSATEVEIIKVPSPGKSDLVVIHGGSAQDGDIVPDQAEDALLVKFITGEIRKATPITAPYGEEGDAAVALADKVVMDKEAAFASLSEDFVAILKAFYAQNPESLAEGVITLGEDAADGSVTLAVNAGGYDKVMFTAPGNADNLGYVVIKG